MTDEIGAKRMNMVEENKHLRQEVSDLRAKLMKANTAISQLDRQRNFIMAERTQMLAALTKFMPAGTAIDGNMEQKDPAWSHIIFIEMPTGQGLWHVHDSEMELFAHLKPFAGTWDGHSPRQKYDRLNSIKPKGSIITL